jgi:hypothetical protein
MYMFSVVAHFSLIFSICGWLNCQMENYGYEEPIVLINRKKQWGQEWGKWGRTEVSADQYKKWPIGYLKLQEMASSVTEV